MFTFDNINAVAPEAATKGTTPEKIMPKILELNPSYVAIQLI